MDALLSKTFNTDMRIVVLRKGAIYVRMSESA